MAHLTRPDGARIHWEQRGQGATLHILNSIVTSTPSAFEPLLSDLATDHRVVTWDARGGGRSTRERPYDLTTDVGDLTALIEEVAEPTVMISLGFVPTSLVVAEHRPELVAAVVMIGGLGFSNQTDPDSLIDSQSVVAASLQMARTDPRGLQRAFIALGNPQLDDAGVRARLEEQLAYYPVESWVERAESYMTYDGSRACAELGARLWLVHWANPLSPGRPMEHMRTMLPDAHILEVEDGPISRPDLTAAVVREITGSRAGPGGPIRDQRTPNPR